MKKALLLFITTLCLMPFAQGESFVKSDIALAIMMNEMKLGKSPSLVRVAHYEQSLSKQGDVVEKILLKVLDESFSIKIRRPQNLYSKLPVLLVLGGVQTGKDAIDLIQAKQSMVLVGYEYPVKSRNVDPKSLQILVNNFKKIPLQVSQLIHWISQQVWAGSVNTLGVSFGAMVLPISQRMAHFQGAEIRSSVLAYGGADFKSFVLQEIKHRLRIGQNETRMVSDILSVLGEPIDPLTHVDKIGSKHLLLVNGKEDQIISKESVLELRKNIQRSYDSIWIDGPHIDVDQPQVIEKLNTELQGWYKSLGVILK